MNSIDRKLQLNLLPSLLFFIYIQMRSAIAHIRKLGDIQKWSWLQEQMKIFSQEPSPVMRKCSARKPSAPEVAEVFRDETKRLVIRLCADSRNQELLADVCSPLEVQ